MKIFISLFLLMQIFSLSLFSQQNEKLKKLNAEPYMVLKIKQFDQFVDRFNYKKDFFDKPVDSNFVSQFPRNEYLKTLFNQANDKDTSLNNESLINSFIDSVCKVDFPIVIDKYSGLIIADLNCKVILKNKDQNIKLYLQQEFGDDKSVKWVIIKVNGLNVNESRTREVFIPPTSHEINFMNLSTLLGNKDEAFSLTSKDFKLDQLTIFLNLVNNGDIDFQYVNEITFHILSVPGFVFKVKKFDRDELNSGWLISELKVTDLALNTYINKL